MIVGLGIDVVALDRFQETIERTPGLVERIFTPSEREMGHASLAARWAAKEAVIKAWSGSRFAQRPVLPEGIHRDIEVITDMWGRPRVRLMGAIAEHLADVTIHVSLTHEGDTAAAVAILETTP